MTSRIEKLMKRIDTAKAKLNLSIEESGFSLADKGVQKQSSNIERLLIELYELEKETDSAHAEHV